MHAVARFSPASFKAPLLHPKAESVAKEILAIFMRHRRVASGQPPCEVAGCEACLAGHMDRVAAAIERNEPVAFILPAFPGKSPNPSKVLGTLPDMAERKSLLFLDSLCRRIETIYAPGARILLCSDGRVFNDVVGIPDADITAYRRGLVDLISELGADRLSTFDLDDRFGDHEFDSMRGRLLSDYAPTIESLQAEIRADLDGETSGHALRMYQGITRFLFEDAKRPGQAVSNTALQKESKRRAFQVIQRSRAWDALLAEIFTDAVRLSIHPQACGSRKIGIHLLPTADEWLTPWHCVAVEVQGDFRLMKRSHAELLGARVVLRGDRPSHYVL